MGSLVLGARVVLALVFLAAGVGKLLDPSGSRRALGEFGVPARALRIGAVALPAAELLTAIALLPAQSARWGAFAALALLLLFIAGISRALARGEAPDCHCFGQIHSAPAGRGTLVRNAVLAGLAGVVLVGGPGPSFGAWAQARTATEFAAIAATAAALLAAAALRLWLDNRTLRGELDAARVQIEAMPPGLPVGMPAPEFALTGLDGSTVTLESLCARGRPVALIFMSTHCGGCHLLMPDLARWQGALGEHVTIAVLTLGSAEDNRPMFEEHAVANVLLQDENAAQMSDYRVSSTSTAVVVGIDGTIATASVVGNVTIEPLVRVIVRRQAMIAASGSPVPPVP